ncbi:MAG: hypothetical protein OEV92_06060 [Nitrospinota bacterium]|nr:hypothetical protein [Nitrospinota bacterium]
MKEDKLPEMDAPELPMTNVDRTAMLRSRIRFYHLMKKPGHQAWGVVNERS